MIARRLPLLGLAAFATMAALRVCDPLLPSLAREFGASTGHAGHTVSAFAISYGLALLLYGPLGDRHGKFAVVAVATLACTIGSVACAMAQSLDGLIAFRALSGAAAAGVTPLAMAWIGDSVPYERRQEVLAQLIGATTLGLIAGQSLGGVLADTVGWRSAFGLLALLFAIAGTLMCIEMRRDRMASGAGTPTAALSPRAGLHRAIYAVLSDAWARRMLGFAFLEGMFVFGGLAFLPSYLHERFGLPMSWAGGVPAWGWAFPACLAGGLGFYMLHSTLQTHATQMVPAARASAVTLFSSSLFMGHSLGVAGAAAVVDAQSAVPVFVVSAIALPVLGWRFAAEAGAARSRVPVPRPIGAKRRNSRQAREAE